MVLRWIAIPKTGVQFSLPALMIIEILGTLGSLMFTACYVPQIIKLLKFKDSSSISTNMYYTTIGAYVLSFIYVTLSMGFVPVLMLNYISGLIMCISTLFLIKKYNPKNMKTTDSLEKQKAKTRMLEIISRLKVLRKQEAELEAVIELNKTLKGKK